MKPAVFLDRDGVINHDKGYVHEIKDLEWILDAKETILYLNSKNYFVFVVTNQSGLARGFYSENDVRIFHSFINSELKKIGANVHEFFYSPFHPDFPLKKYSHLAHLRKPRTGMLELAMNKWNFDKEKSFLIGDKKTDIQCAINFGIDGYLYKEGILLQFVKAIEEE